MSAASGGVGAPGRHTGLPTTSGSGPGLVVGLDAGNLLGGGGRTHLIEFLRALAPERHGVRRVIVWAAKETLSHLPEREWIDKRDPEGLNGNLIQRTRWQARKLSKAARAEGCDILFVPGGNVLSDFSPVVTMSRNALPFEIGELLRYGMSPSALRLLLLRLSQGRSFARADGVIFLNSYAERIVTRTVRRLRGSTATIPHGVGDQFFIRPRPQREIGSCTPAEPFRVLYVSTVDLYKHQWAVVRAVGALRKRTGWPLVLDLVGASYNATAERKLQRAIELADSAGQWVFRRGSAPHAELRDMYASADVGVFASSCENMPNILLEMMAAGLPIASSSRGPMPEMLGEAGVLFDPEVTESIEAALHNLIVSAPLRAEMADAAFTAAHRYSWLRCADETCAFLRKVAEGQPG